MESIIENERIFDLGILYARFGELRDTRKARGKRYRLEVILTFVVLAKLYGEDKPSGIAKWAKARREWLKQVLSMKRESMPHRSSYQRILETVVNWEELVQMGRLLC
jgi:hypothetical protein